MAFTHGDLNPGNILTPAAADSPVYLLDHQPFLGQSSRGLALHDLAYAIILWWPPEARRNLASDLIRHWHAELRLRGVEDYPLPRAFDDWRLCVRLCLCIPASRCGEPGGVTEFRWLWEMFVRRVLLALDELEHA